MAGELIVTDYQFEYNDLLFGCDTQYDVEEISGFLGYPTLRSSTVDNFGMHGGSKGRHYAPARQFTVEMNIQGSENALAYSVLRSQLGIAFQPRSQPHDELPFVYQVPPNIKRFVSCRPTDFIMPMDTRYANIKYPHVTLRFECSDPRHYDLETKTEIATLPSPGGGLDFPLQFPLDFGAGSSSVVQLLNNLDAPAHWVASISGPVSNPRIEAVSDIEDEVFFLEFSGLTLITGETLVLNSRDRSITLSGQSRRSLLIPGSRWFTIPPYPDSLTINYTSADYPITTSTVTFVWSDATWGN
jgi:hypothetical protein